MSLYNEQLLKIWEEYEAAGNTMPPTARDVARWAIKQGLWTPQPFLIEKRCAEDLAKAVRQEYRTDRNGRRYRARHSARMRINGEQKSLWADIDKAPRAHMELAFSQRRRQVVGDCHQLKIDVDHYNDNNPKNLPIQMVFDFTEDLEEIKALELPVKAIVY